MPKGLSFANVDPVRDIYKLSWLFWQGFDHGEDKAEFEKEEIFTPGMRKHFNQDLLVAACDNEGNLVSICGLWYSEKTDYAYVEPVCTIPSCRGKGVAKAVIHEALNRVKNLGAKRAFVISDMPFYAMLGFEIDNKRKPIIAMMGLAFKPNIDDLRESPAKYIVTKVMQSNNNANILVVEPNIQEHNVFKLTNYKEAYQKADIVVFLTAHDQFKELEWDDQKVILDFCGIFKR